MRAAWPLVAAACNLALAVQLGPDEEHSDGIVPITSEAAMRDSSGRPIRDCLMPHIAHLAGAWYAFGFGIPANATGDQRYSTTSRPLPPL